jgi:hypothetical protein
MSATEQTSTESSISNFPAIDVGWGEHHGDIRKTMPWIGINRICVFDWRSFDVVRAASVGGLFLFQVSFMRMTP